MNKHVVFEKLKGVLFGKVEKYTFAGKRLLFALGSRPIRRKYIASENAVVRNDVLQIDFFEKNFRPTDVLWDIGSHNGHYSIFAAAVANGENQVFSFEPDRAARKIQEDNIALNQLEKKITIYDLAVSNTDGTIQFMSLDGNSQSHITKDGTVNEANAISIPSKTLNTLARELPTPSFVKIDTEGAEIDILLEGSSLLENKNVRFICELHPYAWEAFGVQYGQFEAILKKYNRKISLLDTQKSLQELPYYGTILF